MTDEISGIQRQKALWNYGGAVVLGFHKYESAQSDKTDIFHPMLEVALKNSKLYKKSEKSTRCAKNVLNIQSKIYKTHYKLPSGEGEGGTSL